MIAKIINIIVFTFLVTINFICAQSCTPTFGLYFNGNSEIIASNIDPINYNTTNIATITGLTDIISAAINIEGNIYHFLAENSSGTTSLYSLVATTGNTLNTTAPTVNNVSELLYNCNTDDLLAFRNQNNVVDLVSLDLNTGNATTIYTYATTGATTVKKSSAAISPNENKVAIIITDANGTTLREYNIITSTVNSNNIANTIYELEYDENDNVLLGLQEQGNNVALGSLTLGNFNQIGAAINLTAGTVVGSGTLDPFSNTMYFVANNVDNTLYNINSISAVINSTTISPITPLELKAAIACSAIVDFEVSNSCEGEAVEFTNTSIGATNFSWDFGDGMGTSNLENPTYTYANIGTYTVTLTVDDCNSGGTLMYQETVEVVVAPIVDLGMDILICANNITIFAGLDENIYDLVWTFGLTGESFPVANSGTYWLTATLGSCSVTDTIEIAFLPPVSVDLGPDVSICDNAGFTLDAGAGTDYTYTWSTMEITQTIEVTTPGNYEVTVTNGICSATDNINVAILSSTSLDLGPDQTICATSYTLNADIGSATATYQWFNNSNLLSTTTSNLEITESGNYSVEITDVGCSSSDEISITLLPEPVANLGDDFTACEGQTITLNAGNTGAMYEWNDLSINETLDITTSGTYSVTITVGTCVLQDDVVVTFVPAPILDLGPDIDICTGEIAELTTGIFNLNFVWSTSETTPIIMVNNSGTYSVSAETNGCTLYDTVVVTIHDIPIPNLGPDQTICAADEEEIILEVGNEFESYEWSPIPNSASLLIINYADTFAVSVTDTFGCIGSDEIIISPLCNAVVNAPTAFSPNGDGENEMFLPQLKFIDNYLLQIYNRYGELMFATTDQTKGWDGKYKNLDQPISVFVFVIRYRNQGLEEKYYRGNVTLIR